jgi:hypothetical protein
MRHRRPQAFVKNTITQMTSPIYRLIKWIGAILVIFFGYLQMRNIPIVNIVNSMSPDILRQTALFIYYPSWVYGSTWDTKIRERTYYVNTGQARLPLTALLLIVAFGIVTGLLLWLSGNDRGLSIILDILFFANMIGWIYILRFTKRIVTSSRDFYNNHENFLELLKLETVTRYTDGGWHWYRFLTGIILLIALNIASFSPEATLWVAEAIFHLIPALEVVAIAKLLPSVLLMIFVLVITVWIWCMRLITEVSLSVLDRLHARYAITLRPDAQGRR